MIQRRCCERNHATNLEWSMEKDDLVDGVMDVGGGGEEG